MQFQIASVLLQIGDNESRRGRFSLSSRNEAAHWEQAGPGLANGIQSNKGRIRTIRRVGMAVGFGSARRRIGSRVGETRLAGLG